MQILILCLVIATALMGGVFFTFSTFVMTALSNLQPAAGIRAMQRINIDVFCWPFALLFFGLPILLAGLGVYSIFNRVGAYTDYQLAGSVIYVGGAFLVTVFGNVPLNNQLARLDPDADASANLWQQYIVAWTRWNHVRTIACLAASVLLLLSSI